MQSFSAIVLTGGASRRMGTDKAFLDIDGEPLVRRLVRVLGEAGASSIVAIGGDLDRLRAGGLDARPDVHPGQGPLGGLLTGFAAITTELAFVTACDHPALDARLPRELVERHAQISDALVVVPVVHGHRQVLAALFHRGALFSLQQQFDAGERSLRRAIGAFDHATVVEVEGLTEEWFTDLDTPDDVDHYALGDGRPGG